MAEDGVQRLGKIEIRTCTGAEERKMACWRRHYSSRVADKCLRARADVCVGWMCALVKYVVQPRGACEHRKSYRREKSTKWTKIAEKYLGVIMACTGAAFAAGVAEVCVGCWQDHFGSEGCAERLRKGEIVKHVCFVQKVLTCC